MVDKKKEDKTEEATEVEEELVLPAEGEAKAPAVPEKTAKETPESAKTDKTAAEDGGGEEVVDINAEPPASTETDAGQAKPADPAKPKTPEPVPAQSTPDDAKKEGGGEKSSSEAADKEAKEKSPETAGLSPEEAAIKAKLGKTSVDSSMAKLGRAVTDAIMQSPKTRTYTVAIMTLGAVIFFVLVTIVPTISTIGRINSEIKEKQSVVEKLETNIATIETLEKQREDLSDDFDVFDDSFPYDLEEGIYTANIRSLASGNSLTFGNIQFTPQLEDSIENMQPEFRQVDVSIVVQGSVTNIAKFLNQLEGYHRLVTVESVALSEASTGDTDKDAYIRGSIYVVRPVVDWQEYSEELQATNN